MTQTDAAPDTTPSYETDLEARVIEAQALVVMLLSELSWLSGAAEAGGITVPGRIEDLIRRACTFAGGGSS